MNNTQIITDDELSAAIIRGLSSLPSILDSLDKRVKKARARGNVDEAFALERKERELWGSLRKEGLLKPDPFDMRG